jgi:hypothetical protein
MHESSDVYVLKTITYFSLVLLFYSDIDTFYQCLITHDRNNAANIQIQIIYIATMGNQSSRGGTASERTAFSDVTDLEGSSTKLPSLHGNLMRSQHKRDPMKCVRR